MTSKLSVSFIFLGVFICHAAPPVVSDVSLADQIPDLVQTDPKGKFARGGKSFCGPVAASNSLVWLKTGKKSDDFNFQYSVVNKLASAEYMKVDPVDGIGAKGLIRGVSRYVEKDIGDSDFVLKYQGWRSTPKEHFTGVRDPQVKWIQGFVGMRKTAWINLGWYSYDAEKDEYVRVGGHWVTVVGYGVDEKGKPNERMIVIHDPSPRTGADPNDYVFLSDIKTGTLLRKNGSRYRSASGLLKMGGGMHIKSSADVALIDGVVGLDLK